MYEQIERSAATLGYYAIFVAILTSIAYVFGIETIPIYLPVLIVSAGGLCFLVSFISFRRAINTQASSRELVWGIVLIPFILYLPLNLVLLYFGVVELRFNDFGAYYNAAVRFLNGAPLYKTTAEIATLEAQTSTDMGYLYPPIFVLLFVPFTVLSPLIAGIVWDLICLTFLIWSVSKLVATFDCGINRKHRLLIYIAVASFAPTLTWMKLGQISGLTAGMLCLAGATLRTEQHMISGSFTTLGGVIKPFYLTSGAHLLRNRKRFFGALLSGGGILIAGVLIFGIDTHIEYIGVLREGKGWGAVTGASTWHATHFNPFYILGPLKHLPRVMLVLGTIGIALYSNRSETPIEYIFALGVAIIPLAGPTTNTLALNAAIPAILVVGLYEMEKRSEFPLLLGMSALLLHIHPYTIEFLSKFGPRIYSPIEMVTPVIPLLQPALYGMLLLVSYILYRIVETFPQDGVHN